MTTDIKAYYWSYNNDEECIHLSGLDEDGDNVHFLIKGFRPFAHIQIPSTVKHKTQAYADQLKNELNQHLENGKIRTAKITKSRILHYNQQVSTVLVIVDKQSVLWDISRLLKFKRIMGIEPKSFRLHEHNIEPVIKYTAYHGLKLSGWIRVEAQQNEDGEWVAKHNKVWPCDEDHPEQVVFPRYISFDIECYSSNHFSKIPDPTINQNAVFQIGMIVGRLDGDVERRALLTLMDPPDIEGVEVIRCSTEAELLVKFSEFVVETDPAVFMGYNILKFDWQYMIERAEKLGVLQPFLDLSPIEGRPATVATLQWTSAAYGTQKFKYIDCVGRINLDMLLEIERNYKLPIYSLNAVSEKFLDERKVDITPLQLFMLYQVQHEISGQLDKVLLSSDIVRIRARIREILPRDRVAGEVAEYRRRLLRSKTLEEMKENIREPMKLVGVYCVQDCNLPVRLCEKLNIWVTMSEMSNCTNVPIVYLHTRGQQIKVVSQVYRQTLFDRKIIPHKEYELTEVFDYQGATVLRATIGYHRNVATLDFASLYPSVMMTYNVCPTTLIKDPSKLDKDDYITLEFEEHSGCNHDPDKDIRTTKAVICGKHKYHFRKLKVDAEGNRHEEGLLPKLVRQLLTERRAVKKKMAVEEAIIRIAQNKADPDDLKFYQSKLGLDVDKYKDLTDDEIRQHQIRFNVFNAQQLALKISANSVYGSMGVKNGMIPFVPGAASVTAMGRRDIKTSMELANEQGARTIYGDTDSIMVMFDGKSIDECFHLAEELSHFITHQLKCRAIGIDVDTKIAGRPIQDIRSLEKLPMSITDEEKALWWTYQHNPIDLEFENMYGKFFMLSKKRYIAHVINREGKLVSVTMKGNVLARRNGCRYSKNFYSRVLDMVLEDCSQEEVDYRIDQLTEEIFTRQVPNSHCVMNISVKDVKGYAKKKDTKKEPGPDNPWIDHEGEYFTDPSGPLDPRLVYDNKQHIMFALKLLRRGEIIPPNTRLEYVALKPECCPDAQTTGELHEDYTFFKDNRKSLGLQIDPLYYIEKQVINPVSQLYFIRYPPEEVEWESTEDKFTRLLGELDNEYLKNRLSNSRSKKAKAKLIIRSAREPENLNEFSAPEHSELVEAARAWYARQVLQTYAKQYGVTYNFARKPPKGKWYRNSHRFTDALKYRQIYHNVVLDLEDIFKEHVRKPRVKPTQ